eukprot:SAG11_NODE_22794_length_400_cov_0.684385_1_plen_41_part_01
MSHLVVPYYTAVVLAVLTYHCERVNPPRPRPENGTAQRGGL